ncbi:MAG TPA: penicillin-binding transpeptidase domain-containing protein, partial [Longimicrobium sp.]|nr:penicillin-binding transpeptidase domain-containing protein [Longimicrobium sp.]
ELVRAFAAFDNGGILVTPHFIRRVEDTEGNVLWEPETGAESRVMEPEAAFVLTSMLRDVVDRGTATPVRAAGFRGPAAGKTGTTNGATDVWFVGYTPDLVASVWFGFDKPSTIVSNASGGSLAGPVWARIMNRIYQQRRMPAAWAQPGGVVSAQVDRRTGLAIDASCPGSGQPYTEYFIRSAPVRQACYPSAPYPDLAGDSLWRDEEAGAWAYTDTVGMGGTTDLERRGIDWPELEAQRRRQGTAGVPPATPLPGNVEDPYAPPPQPREPPRRREPPPLAGEPPVSSEGQREGGSRREPRVIGTPVEGRSSGGTGTGGSPPPPPPPPPPPAPGDSAGAL